MEYRDFSSMPPEEERQFVSFERRTVTSAKKAWQLAYIAAAAFGVLTVIVVLSFDPPKNQHAEDLETSLSAEQDLRDDDSSEPAPSTADDSNDEDEGDDSGDSGESDDGASGTESDDGASGTESGAATGAAGGDTAAEAPAKEMPAPPKGATKAPPTAIVGE